MPHGGRADGSQAGEDKLRKEGLIMCYNVYNAQHPRKEIFHDFMVNVMYCFLYGKNLMCNIIYVNVSI